VPLEICFPLEMTIAVIIGSIVKEQISEEEYIYLRSKLALPVS